MKIRHHAGVLLCLLSFAIGLDLGEALSPAPARATEGEKANWKQKWEEMVAGAKKEGNLTVYTTASGTDLRKTSAAFTEKYGIKVDVLSARGPELLQKMEAQRRAGKNEVDVVIAGGTNLVFQIKPKGYLDRLDEVLILPEVTDPKAWISGAIPYIDKERYATNIVASFARPLIRNTNLVKEGEISSYKDLLRPRWTGKIVLSDPSIAGSSNSMMGVLAAVWGIEGTKDFLRQLVKQEPAVTRDLRQQVEWVARGKYEIGLGTHGATVAEFIQLGTDIYPVVVTEGSEITSMSYGLGIVNKRPNPNAAVVFANWVLSREGHGILVRNARVPGSRLDSPREGLSPIFFSQPGEKFFFDTEEDFKRQTEMLKVAADILAPLLK